LSRAARTPAAGNSENLLISFGSFTGPRAAMGDTHELEQDVLTWSSLSRASSPPRPRLPPPMCAW
jgi:hypothetical protein